MSGDVAAERQAGTGDSERIAKRIARSGLCSRRDAEQLIAAGRVRLNGRVLVAPGTNVGPADRIEIDGKPLATRERTRLWLFNKPKGLVTTNRDPQGRATIFSIFPPDLPRVMTIGRLDINTEGLLLLTNDGGLARILELPSTGWLRRYRVRAHGEIDQSALDTLRRGVTIDGMVYGAVEAKLDRIQGSNLWLTVGLREGKNREVKRVLEHLGLGVNRLIRVSYGPFQLGDLRDGAVEEVRGRVLRDQLGEKLAVAAGADFDAPLREREPEPKSAKASRKGKAPPPKPRIHARRRRSP
jgi:23S rRNA pseudouridine2605 synthase